MDSNDLVSASNVCSLLNEEQIKDIGLKLKAGYDQDRESRAEWEQKYARVLKLALQIAEEKSFPWPGASNVKFPLITIAALNWHARALPALIPGDQVVRCKVVGPDESGKKAERTRRVGPHMSYQLMEESDWEEQTDKGLLIYDLIGTMFKKTYRDSATKSNVSELVIPQDLVVNYWTKSMSLAPRASHRMTFSQNEVYEYVEAGVFRSIPEEYPPYSPPSQTVLEVARDRAQATSPPPSDPKNGPHFLVECSCWLDLDEDGYAEPYAVTFEENSGYVYRVLARYYKSGIKKNKDGKIQRIVPENYYTKFEFIPSPDGGFYGIGLGHLLGPISGSVDTAINQIFDAGTMNTLGGGFLGKGIRARGGTMTFGPNVWKTIESTGASLKDNIVPLPTKEPSNILLELIKFLVNYGERVGGVGDIQVGELPGQNVKTGTAEIANENGRKIFNATYKRYVRAEKEEFRKIYRLNQLHIASVLDSPSGKLFDIQQDDYNETDAGIVPVADPNITSDEERFAQAAFVYQLAMTAPGFDKYLVTKELLEAKRVDNIDGKYPDPKGPKAIQPPPNPKLMEIQLKMATAEAQKQRDQMDLQIKAGTMMFKAKESQAKILKLQAEALKLTAEAEGADKDRMLEAIQIAINAEMAHRDDLMEVAKMFMEHADGKDGPGTVPPVEKPPGNTGPVQAPQGAAAGVQGPMGAGGV